MTPAERLTAAARNVTPTLYRFFQAEWTNEHDGGISPATVSSAIDSLAQAPEVFADGLGLEVGDVAALALIRDLVPGRTPLSDLASDDAVTAAGFAARAGTPQGA